MKKVRINLNKGVKTWSFFLYDSPESAFYLKELHDDEDFDEEYRKLVEVYRSDVVEVEWMGSEWVYHDELGKSEKYDNVRLAKLVTRGVAPSEANMGYVEIYSGWTHGDVFRWCGRQDSQSNVKVTPIKGRVKSKLDFSEIFLKQEEEDGEEDLNPNNEIVLN